MEEQHRLKNPVVQSGTRATIQRSQTYALSRRWTKKQHSQRAERDVTKGSNASADLDRNWVTGTDESSPTLT